LLEPFIASSASPPSVIVRDVDDTEDPVHGEQEQARSDSYYGGRSSVAERYHSFTQEVSV
jgi:hypothetical protein